jgi:hypothetical protein
MAQLVAISIDLTKIDKSKIVDGKNGGKYLNLTVSLNDDADQYGNNVSAWQGQTKEEREAKENRNFLGNGKTLWSGGETTNTKTVNKPVEDDGLPF